MGYYSLSSYACVAVEADALCSAIRYSMSLNLPVGPATIAMVNVLRKECASYGTNDAWKALPDLPDSAPPSDVLAMAEMVRAIILAVLDDGDSKTRDTVAQRVRASPQGGGK
jgi:hypothetical protein